jgi:hypothetical protein
MFYLTDFLVVGWTREAFSFLPHAEVCWLEISGYQTSDNICICHWPCKGFSLYWSWQANWYYWGKALFFSSNKQWGIYPF